MQLFDFFRRKKDQTVTNKNHLEIYDSSGFIGLVNSELYTTFIDEDWELDDVLERFRTETNKAHCAIWSTGTQNLMSIDLVIAFTPKTVFREINTQIKVTNGCLYLVNYDDLTMCAQFSEYSIPSDEHSNLKFDLENGLYNLSLRQLFDPEHYTLENYPEPCFDFKLELAEDTSNQDFKNVIWRED